MAEKCMLSQGMTILDVGCGSRRSAVFLAKEYGCRTVGVDIELGSLMRAQAEAISKGLADRVTFRVADANYFLSKMRLLTGQSLRLS